MTFTQSGYTFDFISDPTAPNGYILQCPVGPVLPVSNLPQFVYTFYSLIYNGNAAAPSAGAFDGNLIPSSVTATYQAVVTSYLVAMEGAARFFDPSSYQTAYDALVPVFAPYGAPWLTAGDYSGGGVPVVPPLYLFDQNQVPAQLAAWQSFITTVFDIVYANNPDGAIYEGNILGFAAEPFTAAYGSAYVAYVAAYDAAQAAYDAALTVYNDQAGAYNAARAAAIAWRAAHPHIVNGQPAG